MCRWVTLMSSETFSMSDIVLAPKNSLVKLAKDASFLPNFGEVNNAQMNGDGFGVGWYHGNVTVYNESPESNDGGIEVPEVKQSTGDDEDEEEEEDDPTTTPHFAALYKDTQPAWNDENLREICKATRANCIMAHVRAKSTGAAVSRINCHPFKAGRLLFCHNGRIQSFQKIRRKFVNHLSDAAFREVKGNTDSEVLFGLILTFLGRDKSGKKSPIKQKAPFGHKRLVNAIKRTYKLVETIVEEAGMTEGYNTLNFSLTDGVTMVCSRYCDKAEKIPPPSLYFAFGEAADICYELTNEGPPEIKNAQPQSEAEASTEDDDQGSTAVPTDPEDDDDFEEREIKLSMKQSKPGKIMVQEDPETAAFIVSSNPLTESHTWHPMPRNSVVWYSRGTHPELRLLRRSHKGVIEFKPLPQATPPKAVVPEEQLKEEEEPVEPAGMIVTAPILVAPAAI